MSGPSSRRVRARCRLTPRWVGVALLMLLGMGPPLGAADGDPLADQITLARRLTAELLTAAEAGSPIYPTRGQRSLLEIARERYEVMRILQQQAPGEFLRLAMTTAERESLPVEVRGLVEAYVMRLGSLRVTIEENLGFEQSLTSYVLEDGAASYVLQFVADPPRAFSGEVAVVSGIELSGTITLVSGTESAGFRVLGGADSREALGEQKTLILLANLQDYPETLGITPLGVHRKVFSSGASVNAFFEEASYGKTWLTGDVVGWYTLPFSAPLDPDCAFGAAHRAATMLAADPEVDFTNYRRFVFLFVMRYWDEEAGQWSVCVAGGNSDVGSSIRVTPDGPVWATDSTISQDEEGVFAHELGHALGMWHANGWTCPPLFSAGGTLDPACSVGYWDPFEVMGGRVRGHPNAPHKETLAWLEPSQLIDIDISQQGGQFTIEPIAVNSPTPKALRIHRGAFEPVYYVEHRWPIGFDAEQELIGGIQHGALLHWTHKERPIINVGDTQLTDTTLGSLPGSQDATDAAVLAGQSFQEPVLGFELETLLADAGGLVVDVQPIAPSVLAPPVGLTTVALSPTEISVFWQAVPDATSYTVFRHDPDDSPAVPVPAVGTTTEPRFLDASVPAGGWRYTVRWADANNTPSVSSLPVDVHTGFENDGDGDGFSASAEFYLGTRANQACATAPGDDAWPPDLNRDGRVTTADRNLLQPRLGSALGEPGYARRYDLHPDGQLDANDTSRLEEFLNQSCGPPPPQLPPAAVFIMQPDVTYDGTVDLFGDIFAVASAFGLSYYEPGYKLSYDVNADGIVDLFNDIFGVAAAFGTSGWQAVNSASEPLTVPLGTTLGLYVLATRDGAGQLPVLSLVGGNVRQTLMVSDTGLGRRGRYIWTPMHPQERVVVAFKADYGGSMAFRELYLRAE
ncbi:MAG: hypothetical protein Q8R78_06335 [Candidatus Omnitrophota bacterium]|nr:hypothetical protein [Candidatus Omnitrophota bacterium]